MKTKRVKKKPDKGCSYSVSYKSKYENVIDTTFHNTAKSLGNDVAWLLANGYKITSVKRLNKKMKGNKNEKKGI